MNSVEDKVITVSGLKHFKETYVDPIAEEIENSGSGNNTDLGEYLKKTDVATINGQSIVDGGNIEIQSGGSDSIIDTTLMKSGEAADAKVVGDNFAKLKDGIDFNFIESQYLSNDYLKSYFNKDNGFIAYQNASYHDNNIYSSNLRVMTTKAVKFSEPVIVKAKNGYKIGITTWLGEEIVKENFIRDSGWVDTRDIPANTYFAIVLRNIDNTSEVNPEDANKMFEVLNPNLFEYSGEKINTDARSYKTENLEFGSHTWINQGLAIHNGIVFNFLSNNNRVYLYSLFTKSLITNYSITAGHASSACFSDEYYEDTDEFPLLYVSDCHNPKVYINRVTHTGATLVKTLYFGTNEEVGYYTAHCLDTINKRLYLLGYTNDSYYAENNSMILSVWNMLDLTENEDGTYTPAKIESTNIAAVNVSQDMKFFDGKIAVLASTVNDTKIYFLNPVTKLFTTVMEDFGTDLNRWEVEGFDFVKNENGTKYEIICDPIQQGFYKIKFS